MDVGWFCEKWMSRLRVDSFEHCEWPQPSSINVSVYLKVSSFAFTADPREPRTYFYATKFALAFILHALIFVVRLYFHLDKIHNPVVCNYRNHYLLDLGCDLGDELLKRRLHPIWWVTQGWTRLLSEFHGTIHGSIMYVGTIPLAASLNNIQPKCCHKNPCEINNLSKGINKRYPYCGSSKYMSFYTLDQTQNAFVSMADRNQCRRTALLRSTKQDDRTKLDCKETNRPKAW